MVDSGDSTVKVWIAISALVATLVGSLALTQSARTADPACQANEVTYRIVKAKACWRETPPGEKQPTYDARFIEQPGGKVDLNGFLVGPAPDNKGGGLRIITSEARVVSTGRVQLYSAGYPSATPTPIGVPRELSFSVPPDGPVVIDTLRFGSDSPWTKTFAGFVPATVETPVTIDDGAGSIDMTLALTGIFALKGKPQSATISLPTEVGKGTSFNGFSLELNELDALKFVTLSNLSAYYVKSDNSFGGEATVVLPFFGDPTGKGGKGVTAGFGIKDGMLNRVKFGVVGLEIPIGAPPGGYLTSMDGEIQVQKGEGYLKAGVGASLGKAVDLPWAKQVTPVGLSAGVEVGAKNGVFVFKFKGGVTIFNMGIGSAYLNIYSDAGMEFGGTVGIGLPSFKNNKNDPFYLGVGMDGWIAAHGFQLEGWGKISLFGYNALSGRAMISNTAIGACVKIFRWDAGAVYAYGRGVTFGWSCGIDRYKQKFRKNASASISAGESRSIELGPNEVVVKVRGEGAAPRFEMVADDGRRYVTPTEKDGVLNRDRGYGFFIDEPHKVTNVVLREPEGRWRIEPLDGSTTITGVSAGRTIPEERVRGRVSGSGQKRQLTWTSNGGPRTKLLFTEVLKGGVEKPIQTTGKANGRIQFKPARGLYGKRRLKVDVIHGGTIRSTKILDRYLVRKPPRLGPPKKIRAWKTGGKVQTSWSRVPGAHGYMVRVVMPAKVKGKTRQVSFADFVGRNHTRTTFHDYPGGKAAVALVYALNADGRLGHPARAPFLTGPNAKNLKQAAHRSGESARRRPRSVHLTTICPSDGVHCLVRTSLKQGGKTIATKNFQQPPDTFRRIALPITKRASQANYIRLDISIRHVGKRAAGSQWLLGKPASGR